MAHVVLTSHYPEIAKIARRLARKFDFDVTIIESALDEAVEAIKDLIEDPVNDIIISRGATAHLLEQEFPESTILRIDPNEFDLIQALHQAKQMGKQRIGFLGPAKDMEKYKLEQLAMIMDMNVAGYWYRNTLDFNLQVEKAKLDNIEVIIGGGLRGKEMCEIRNISHISLLSGELTIFHALERANDILQTRAKEQLNTKLIKTIVDIYEEGIVAIESSKKIVIFNQKASNIFQVNPAEVINQDVSKIQHEHLHLLLEDSKNDRLLKISDKTYLVRCLPFSVDTKGHHGKVYILRDTLEIQQSEQQIRRKLHQKGLAAKYTFDDIIYHKHSSMSEVVKRAKKFASVDSNVLIIGESGTGKELIAQSMHNAHPIRRHGPFVAVNCAALPDSLLKSELFGYVQGSFTGAQKEGKPGLFELAHGGTIFLDEIGKVSLDVQSKLLRVLQEREVRRIGDNKNIPIDVRVIAAANEDFHAMIDKGNFRSDLFYRLEVLVLQIPPLSQRREDIPLLVHNFLYKYGKKYHKPVIPLDDKLVEQLTLRPWPGNIRQLENFIERIVVLSDEEKTVNHVLYELLSANNEAEHALKGLQSPSANALHQPAAASHPTDLASVRSDVTHITVPVDTMDNMQKYIVQRLAQLNQMSKRELAKKLGISRTTLWKWLQ